MRIYFDRPNLFCNTEQKTWSPEQFLIFFLPSSYSEKMRWKWGRQLKSCLNLVYFHSYSFVTCMTYISSDIFISNVLLKAQQQIYFAGSLVQFSLVDMTSSFQVRIRILSRKVGYLFWVLMNSEKSHERH